MKNPQKRACKNKSDDLIFAKKILSQLVVSLIVFAVVFINSRLNNNLSVNLNNQIKHYLTTNIDFNKTINVAVSYFQDFLKQNQVLPVSNGVSTDITEAEK